MLLILLDTLLVTLEARLSQLQPLTLLGVTAVMVLLCNAIFALASQPRSRKKAPFEVPCVPFIPILSMFVNFYLMLKLSYITWIRFAIWMAIG